jgi:hypothetical protein
MLTPRRLAGMRRVSLVVSGFLLLGACATTAAARAGAVLQVRLVPEHPLPGTMATLAISGTTAKTGIVLVLAVTSPSCPARIPSGAHVLVPPNPLWTGGISSDLRVRVGETAKRYCVYLVPAEQDAYGKTSYEAAAPPLATAEVLVGAAPRLAGGGAFGSGTSDNTSLQLIVARNGSTITKIIVTCGGNPLRPSALGKAFIGKRFTARVFLPLASHIRWAGFVLPDNSNNYDAPIPARWNGRVRYSLNANVRTVGGTSLRLTGTGVLSGAGLPCPKVRRYR